jgi:hypothetical protein
MARRGRLLRKPFSAGDLTTAVKRAEDGDKPA